MNLKVVLSFGMQKILNYSKLKDDNFKLKMAESFWNGYKTLWEKDKLLVSSNFSFSHNI